MPRVKRIFQIALKTNRRHDDEGAKEEFLKENLQLERSLK
jgi:hypothetical protein